MARDVLVDGYTLLVGAPDRAGIAPDDDGGLYFRDTRHLSTLAVTLDGVDVETLGRDLTGPNRRVLVATDDNTAINRVDESTEKRSDLVLETRQTVSGSATLSQEVRLVNHSSVPYSGEMTVEFDVDFADVFEVRGFRSRLERDPSVTVDDRTVAFSYAYETSEGTSLRRETRIAFDRTPTTLTPTAATFDVDLEPQEETTVGFEVRASVAANGERTADGGSGSEPEVIGERSTVSDGLDVPAVKTGRRDYDRVFRRAGEDLLALTADTEYGLVPLAGAPWFATVFGRDSLIAAYQALPLFPSLARGTLRYLAAYQGTAVDDTREEEPGKMFHEIRQGELAERGRIPHSPYYGSVDSTPLWIALLAAHRRWTGNDTLVTELAETLDGAVSWLRRSLSQYGDDPFVYYEESQTMGMLHKAWRDTPGSVQYPDGEIAEPPIASVEVQGYAYRALRDAADLYGRVFDDPSRASELQDLADRLADAFDSTFWLPDAGYYGVAKDGTGTTVPTLTSNVGHCLWAGIVTEERATPVAETLMSDRLFSGWGIRTMSTAADGYSPISYHLGSVWPHDTSLSALGLSRYGFQDETSDLARAVLDASTHFDDYRIPELFCGFDDTLSPKPYASSCVPQAWSAGAPFAFLRALFAVEPTETGIDVGNTSTVLDTDALDPLRERWEQ